MDFCPRCMQRNESVRIERTGMVYTCLGYIKRRDAMGLWHDHDGNEGAAHFTCPNGCEGRILDTVDGLVFEYDDGGMVLKLPPSPRCWCGWPAIDGPDLETVRVGSISEGPGISIVNAKAVRMAKEDDGPSITPVRDDLCVIVDGVKDECDEVKEPHPFVTTIESEWKEGSEVCVVCSQHRLAPIHDLTKKKP